MLAFYIRKEKPYSLKDVEFYLYLLVFVLPYLLMKEVFSRLPEPFEYFYPQLGNRWHHIFWNNIWAGKRYNPPSPILPFYRREFFVPNS